MLVYEFMIPAEKVIKCLPSDTIDCALDKIFEHHISAVVIVSPTASAAENGEKDDKIRGIGIVTKTDIAKAYKQGLPLTEKVESIMSDNVVSVNKSLQRDLAARVFSKHKIHHAIVVDNEEKFVGFISAWDCAKEGALDHQSALPWSRRMMGRQLA